MGGDSESNGGSESSEKQRTPYSEGSEKQKATYSEGSEKQKAAYSEGSEKQKAAYSEGSEKRKAAYSTRTFTWGHGKNKYWNEVKVHPESGSKMTNTNIIHKDTNPCMKEYHLSMKCLADMSYKKELCAPYFDNYRICKIFWMKVVRDRRARGITPMVPPHEEQEAVKQEYLKKEGFVP